jgi:hypothetical protein
MVLSSNVMESFLSLDNWIVEMMVLTAYGIELDCRDDGTNSLWHRFRDNIGEKRPSR